ncbi:hypothetical protein [Deinococcus sp.]|uniref:hypothetical protein n=1 Tax=Deinococcus sp. TaxID=47478 RepID=UPI002869C870|nr:hypothetical protein [Deinococcus sp.]
MSSVRPCTYAGASAVAAVQFGNVHHDDAPFFPPGDWEGMTVEEQTGDWEGWLPDHPADVLLVAENAGGVVGYVLARVHPYHGAAVEVITCTSAPSRAGGVMVRHC